MNTKLFGLSIFAIAFALFLATVPNGAMAASDNYNEAFVGIPNLLGVDEADNAVGTLDRDKDRAPVPNFQPYGLQGDWLDQR